MTLVPCAGCHRHVREDAVSCPFCAHLSATPRPDDGARFSAPAGTSRTHVLALGLLAATSATACGAVAPAPAYGGPPPAQTISMPAYGMPVPPVPPPTTSTTSAPAPAPAPVDTAKPK